MFMFIGQLEWQDKKSMGPMQGASSKITRNLLCMVSIGQTDPEMWVDCMKLKYVILRGLVYV